MSIVVFVIDEDEVPDVENVMMGIRAKDETFRYKIAKSNYEKGKYVLIVYCMDRDDAYRKGAWIRDRVFDNGKLYWVK